jgi:hypothetical protein
MEATPLACHAVATVAQSRSDGSASLSQRVPVNNVISFLHVAAVNKGRKVLRTSLMGSGRDMGFLLQ